MAYFVGTDVGGTFTDLWVSETSGATRVFKTPTTKDVLTGVLDAVKLAAEAFDQSFEEFCSQIQRFGHGTTVGLNALLTGNAAKTAVVTTRGFADTLEIGRLKRQTSGLNETEVIDSYLRNRYRPLVPRRDVIEVDERIDVNGVIITPLDEAQAKDALKALGARGIEALAICTLFSTVNPVHERRLREIAREQLPGVFVSVSHEISPNIGEYARMSTTAANAALGPLAGRYLSKLETSLQSAGMTGPVLMMTCSGGVLPTAILSDRPAFALFSGPAAGVMGSRISGEQIGIRNILTTDIGGTSFDVGVIVDGRPVMRSEISVGGADIRVHSIDVDSIGAGGGSIAWLNSANELQVGPWSAGSTPGPACYGRGGVEPTSTDADLVLGVLDPANFLGGRMKLDVEAARRAIGEKIARPLNLGVEEAAWGIRQILDAKMADLLRRATLERGYDPRDFTLFANGGAGPSHAWVLSAEIGLNGFIVPAAATAQSALGAGTSDLGFTTERPAYTRIQPGRKPSDDELQRINAALNECQREVDSNLTIAAATSKTSVERFVSIRFRGQTNHIDVPVKQGALTLAGFDAVTAEFEREYETLFGHGASYSGAGYEVLSVRVTGTGGLPPPKMQSVGEELVRGKSRNVIFDDPRSPVETAIYRANFPKHGTKVDGPCVIEFPGQSVVVPPRAAATADQFGNLHVKLAS